MNKGPWLAVVGVLALVIIAAHAILPVVILAVIGIMYVVSLRFHPRTRHGRCNGTGEHRSSLFSWAHRRCGGCAGGRVIRAGAVYLGGEEIKNEHKRAVAARASARDGNRWR